MRNDSRRGSIVGLSSDGPYPKFKDKLMLFGQFVGDWDIVSVQSPSPSGVPFKARGEVHFGWILEGRAVQDVWMTYDDKSKRAIPVGTTIRVYDPSIDAWLSTWISAIRRSVQTFVDRPGGHDERWLSRTLDFFRNQTRIL
jgi:hypothetical protein